MSSQLGGGKYRWEFELARRHDVSGDSHTIHLARSSFSLVLKPKAVRAAKLATEPNKIEWRKDVRAPTNKVILNAKCEDDLTFLRNIMRRRRQPTFVPMGGRM